MIPKIQEKDQQTARELRDIILYEDILKNQKKILLYDTNGIQYKQVRLYLILMIAGTIAGYYLLEECKRKSLNLKVELDYTREGKMIKVCVGATLLFAFYLMLAKYRRLQRAVVEKVIYDTESAEF